jgi:hypothetical protein
VTRDGDYYGDEFDNDYDEEFDEHVDYDDLGEWLIDDGPADPELDGRSYYDELLDEYENEPDENWDDVEEQKGAEADQAPFALASSAAAPALPPGALRFGSPPVARTDTPVDPEVWHLTHVFNLELMCERGTLAPAPMCPYGVRPGLRDLVGKRARRPTELGPMVGDCVPFYFTVATPFSYLVLTPEWSAELVEPAGTRTIRTQPSHYVFLRSTVRRVVDEGTTLWMVTNGNAGAFATQGWRSLNHLHCVDWSAVTSRWSNANQAARQAELLIHREIDLDLLTSFHAATDDMADLIRSVAGRWANRVVVDPEVFARARGR